MASLRWPRSLKDQLPWSWQLNDAIFKGLVVTCFHLYKSRTFVTVLIRRWWVQIFWVVSSQSYGVRSRWEFVICIKGTEIVENVKFQPNNYTLDNVLVELKEFAKIPFEECRLKPMLKFMVMKKNKKVLAGCFGGNVRLTISSSRKN